MTTGALDKVLFVRANQDLLDRLEKLRLRKSEAAKVTLSTADVARAILLDALDDEDLEKK
jgi:DTW domain-containing protein YfiP